jgi:hypothetical protein
VTQKAGRYRYQDAYGNEIRGWRVLYLGVWRECLTLRIIIPYEPNR